MRYSGEIGDVGGSQEGNEGMITLITYVKEGLYNPSLNWLHWNYVHCEIIFVGLPLLSFL